MRVIPWIAVALVLSVVTPALAQEDWDNFKFPEDGFEVNFPGKPQVQATTYMSQYRYSCRRNLYTASHGAERYSVTVVDYSPAEALGLARAEKCPPGAETCIGTQDGRQGGIIGLGYWKMDVRGAMTYASLKFMQRDGAKVTDFNLQFEQVVEGYFLQLTNKDQSRTLRLHHHAREPALHVRGNRAEGRSGAGTVPGIGRDRRCEGRQHPLHGLLLECRARSAGK